MVMYTQTINSLEDHTRDLFDLGNINVLDHDDPDKGESHETRSNRQHARLGISIGMLDSNAGNTTSGVTQLSIQILVDVLEVGHG